MKENKSKLFTLTEQYVQKNFPIQCMFVFYHIDLNDKTKNALPFPILKSLSEQARLMEEDSSACADNIKLFGYPKKINKPNLDINKCLARQMAFSKTFVFTHSETIEI